MESSNCVKQVLDIAILFSCSFLTFFFVVASSNQLVLFLSLCVTIWGFFLITFFDKSLIENYYPFIYSWLYWIWYSLGYFLIFEDDTSLFFSSFALLIVTVSVYLPFTIYFNLTITNPICHPVFYDIVLLMMFIIVTIPFADNNIFLSLTGAITRILLYTIVYLLIYVRLKRRRELKVYRKSVTLSFHILYGTFIVSIIVGVIQVFYHFYCMSKEKNLMNRKRDIKTDDDDDDEEEEEEEEEDEDV